MRALSIRWAMVFALVSFLNFSCSTTSSLTSLLGSNANLSGISSLLSSAGGIDKVMGSSGAYTLLAPSNQALSSLGTDGVQNLLKPENKSQLNDLLKQQIIPGEVTEEQLKSGTVKNAAGNTVNLGNTTLGSPMKAKGGGSVYEVNSLLGK